MVASRPERGRPEGRSYALLLLAAWLAVSPLQGQAIARPLMEGQVFRGNQPADTATVVLHQVTVGEAGAIDSVRVGPDGRFSFELPSVPDPGGRGEVYFGSVRRSGIDYFGPAIHLGAQLDTLYEIVVHDTAVVASGGLDAPLDVRYLLIEPLGQGWQVTDLFQLQVAGDRTLVSGSEDEWVWSYPLPDGIRDFQSANTDLPPDATKLSEGELRIAGPITPGDRQFIVRYVIDDLELTIPAPGRIGQMEFLIREPAPPLDVRGLAAVQPVEMQPGVNFRRYAGADLQDPTIVIVAGTSWGDLPARLLSVAIALLLATAGLLALQRSGAAGARAGAVKSAIAEFSTVDRREAMILEVARVDMALGREDLDPQEAGRLQTRRTSLIRHIQDLG